MAVEANVQYKIRNRSGLVVDVPGSILAELALADEPVWVVSGDGDEDGTPIREFVLNEVKADRQDSVREAHNQSHVDVILDDPQADRERVEELRKYEVDDSLIRSQAVKERPEDQREDPALSPLLGSGQDATSDVTRREQAKLEAEAEAVAPRAPRRAPAPKPESQE